MRILLLTVQYHPAMNPNVFRWAAIAEHWSRQGHEVHVLCARHSNRPDEESMAGVHVHRAGHATLLDWAYNLFHIRRRRSEPGSAPRQPGFLSKLLEKILDLSWRKLYWPDGSCLWYGPARRRAKALLRELPFDAMISVGTPFTVHWVAKACKAQFPRLRWLIDVEDPFCFAEEFPSNNFGLYRRRNYRAEAEAFRLADAVALTNAAALRRYAALFPEEVEKLTVIPPLYALPEAAPDFQLPPKAPGELRLGYFGTFYRRIRTPQRFLELLSEMFRQFPGWKTKLKVHCFGYMEAEFVEMCRRHADLEPNLIFHGLVSREKTAAAMQAMDVLLHIGNSTDYHLPSKSADYLCSGKYILNIATCAEDSFREFAGAYPGLVHFYLPPEAGLSAAACELANFLDRIETAWPPAIPFDSAYVEKCRALHTPAIASAYEKALSLSKS